MGPARAHGPGPDPGPMGQGPWARAQARPGRTRAQPGGRRPTLRGRCREGVAARAVPPQTPPLHWRASPPKPPLHWGGAPPPRPPIKVGRIHGLRNDGLVHGPWPGPMALAHWSRVRPWSMGPGPWPWPGKKKGLNLFLAKTNKRVSWISFQQFLETLK